MDGLNLRRLVDRCILKDFWGGLVGGWVGGWVGRGPARICMYIAWLLRQITRFPSTCHSRERATWTLRIGLTHPSVHPFRPPLRKTPLTVIKRQKCSEEFCRRRWGRALVHIFMIIRLIFNALCMFVCIFFLTFDYVHTSIRVSFD